MYGHTWSGFVFILGRAPPTSTPKRETPDGSRRIGLPSGALYAEGGQSATLSETSRK